MTATNVPVGAAPFVTRTVLDELTGLPTTVVVVADGSMGCGFMVDGDAYPRVQLRVGGDDNGVLVGDGRRPPSLLGEIAPRSVGFSDIYYPTYGEQARLSAVSSVTAQTIPTGALTRVLFDSFSSDSARGVTDAHTTSGSPVITSATAGFTARDVGSTVQGAGVDNTNVATVIASVESATSATMSSNATATATGVHLTFHPFASLGGGVSSDRWVNVVKPGEYAAQLVTTWEASPDGTFRGVKIGAQDFDAAGLSHYWPIETSPAAMALEGNGITDEFVVYALPAPGTFFLNALLAHDAGTDLDVTFNLVIAPILIDDPE